MLPSVLRYQRRWGRWVYNEHGKKQPVAGWGRTGPAMTYDEARAGRGNVGVVLGVVGGLALSGIDLDDCLVRGAVRPWGQDALDRFPSYAETSPSGTGIKILTLGGPAYLSRCKVSMGDGRQGIEAYVSGRLFAFTGDMWSGGFHNKLTECDEGWRWLVDKLGASTVRENVGAAPEHTIEPEVLEEMLSHIPVEEYRDEYIWTGLMMSCHHATNAEGEDVWVAWSISDSEYSEHAEIVRQRWASLSVDKGVGWRPLVAALRRAGVVHLAPPEVRGGTEWPDDE